MKKHFIVITALYLLFEIFYNLGLVEFLTSKNTEISAYDMLESFGKFLSSVGLTLLAIKLIQDNKKKLVAACLLIPCLFVVETAVFNSIVDNLPQEMKVSAYYAGVYRNGVLNGTIEDESLVSLTPYNRVVLANIGSYAAGTRVRSAVDGLLSGPAIQPDIDGLYANYAKLSDSLNPLYEVYALESKKFAEFKGMLGEEALHRFKRRSNGIAPGLTRAQFFQALAGHSSSVARFNETVFIKPNDKLGIPGLRGADLPLGMDRKAFEGFFGKQVALAVSKSKISVASVDNLPYARELVASVVIPPIALALSFVSIVLNASALLYAVKKWLVVLPGAVVVVFACTAGANPHVFGEPIHRAVSLEASLYRALSPVATGIHTAFINDESPNVAEVIVVKRPEPMDFSDLSKQLQDMKTDDILGMPSVDPRVRIDEARLKREDAYYGELQIGSNPYMN
jgi:hypothetical protein